MESTTNPILQSFQERIGQDFSRSPSPLGRWLLGTLLAAEEGSLEVAFSVREEMTNPMAILHGGAIAAIMDDLMGATVFALGRSHFYTSINLNIDFLASAKLGETVRARSNIVRAGSNVIHAESQLYNAAGKLLAKGTSNLIKTAIPVA